MEGPDPHMYLPPMILPGDAGPVNALGYCDMLASSQALLVERPSHVLHRPNVTSLSIITQTIITSGHCAVTPSPLPEK